MMRTLKSCPFCGKPVLMEACITNHDIACVRCSSCGAVVTFMGSEKPEKFIQRWNNRAPSSGITWIADQSN